MSLLAHLGFEVVPLERIARHVEGAEQLSARHVAITFDDGFANLHTHAFPVLRSRGFPSTIFLISQFVGKKNTYHPSEWDPHEPLLDSRQIFEMMQGGVVFGSHTRRHARLTECSDDELREQTRDSRVDLEQLLQTPVTQFCYPYGAQDDRVRAAVVDAGYELACSTRKGRNDVGEDRFRLRRINIRQDTYLPVFLYKLCRAALWAR